MNDQTPYLNEIPSDRRPEGELTGEIERLSRSIANGQKVAVFELIKFSNGYRLTATVKKAGEFTSYEKLEARELVDLTPAIANLQRLINGPAWPFLSEPAREDRPKRNP